jgi:imidazolonepropionase-like amidohydrolase
MSIRSLSVASALLLMIAGGPSTGADTLVVRGSTVHTMAGEPIRDGVVVIRDGRITAVGQAGSIPIPGDATLIDAEVVTPGLIDAHSVVGLTGYLNQAQDQEQLDRSEAIQPELRAIDAYDPRERLIEWVRSFGVTTIHTGHAPGALVSGQTLIAKTRGTTVEEAVMVPSAMVAASLGEGGLAGDEKKPPGTRSKAVAMLREKLVETREYVDRRSRQELSKRPARDLRLEALARVLERELPLLVTAHRHNDLVSALRLAKEFDVRIVLDGASEAYLVLDEIRINGVPVIPHPPMQRAFAEMENATVELPAILDRAEIPFALQSGFESYVPKSRVVLLEAAIAAANGLPWERTLAAMTIDAARLLGIADRVGSLEVGKDADLALYDGDPLEYTSHCIGVIIDGRIVSDEIR